LKVISYKTMSKKKKSEKKVKNEAFMDKRSFYEKKVKKKLLCPWAILATWLHVGAPQKI
jgi:hypothetical protein